MVLTVVSSGRDFPTEHVNRILEMSLDHYEIREMQQGDEPTLKFTTVMAPSTPLAWITQQLTANGTAGVKSVSWSEPSKKS
jgi:hypothetical protein